VLGSYETRTKERGRLTSLEMPSNSTRLVIWDSEPSYYISAKIPTLRDRLPLLSSLGGLYLVPVLQGSQLWGSGRKQIPLKKHSTTHAERTLSQQTPANDRLGHHTIRWHAALSLYLAADRCTAISSGAKGIWKVHRSPCCCVQRAK
jgi:hypothetical protein